MMTDAREDPAARVGGRVRPLIGWAVAAVAAFGLLGAVLRWETRERRWAAAPVGEPATGARLFRDKGCTRCHSVHGQGGVLGPDLAVERPSSGPDQLVTAMWNHAPKMWERFREQHVNYPGLAAGEMAHLFAFLYTARYVGDPGDAQRGERLFESKSCASCHALRGAGGTVGPDLTSRAAVTSLVGWTQAMWNHAPAMQTAMQRAGVGWPRFEENDMADLLAYIRGGRDASGGAGDLLPADPERGRKVFAEKSCGSCHSLQGETGRLGPDLESRQKLPPTVVQLAGAMWNHSPEMWRSMRARDVARPVFREREMADLVAYLYSLHYREPGGSPRMGEVLFAARGCSQCHAPSAVGTSEGPALRGRGTSFNSIVLAAALWRHGPAMYKHAEELGVPWPMLAESDVGDLLSFLNTTPRGDR